MTYSYYDYLQKYYEASYDYYYQYQYWPSYYARSLNISVANYTHNGTYPPHAYTFEHQHDYEYSTAGMSIYIFSWICCLIAGAIFFLAMYRLYTLHIVKRKAINKSMLAILILCLLMHLLQNIFDTVFEHYWWIAYPGWDNFEWIWQIWNVFLLIAKVSLYVLYIARFYLIFQAASLTNENFRRDRIIFITFYSILILAQLILEAWFIHYKVYGTDKDETVVYQMRLAFTFIDIIFMVSIVALIIKCILNIVALQTEKSSATEMGVGATKLENDLSNYISKESTNVEMSSSSPSAKSVDSKVSVQSKSENSTTQTPKRNKGSSKNMDKNVKLIHTIVKIALTCAIACISSFFYNFTHSNQYFDSADASWIVWTWALDVVVNMISVYLSMGAAAHDYKRVCYDCCKCHQCCLKIFLKLMPKDIQQNLENKEFSL